MLIRFALLAAMATASSAVAGTASVNYEPFSQTGFGLENANARASATWEIVGTTLSVMVTNTSITSNPPAVADAAWLLATINFALPQGVTIDVTGAKSVTGGTAVNSPGTRGSNWGLKNGTPSGSTPNAASFRQVISTLNGDYNGGTGRRFDDSNTNLSGPDGGILPNATIAGPKKGWHNSLTFSMTLTGTLTQAQLDAVAAGSNVSFNSHGTFLNTVTLVPLPTGAVLGMAGLGLVGIRRRR